MELNSKLQIEQPAPPGVHRQRSDKRDEQTNKQETNKKTTFLAAPAAAEIRAPPNLSWR